MKAAEGVCKRRFKFRNSKLHTGLTVTGVVLGSLLLLVALPGIVSSLAVWDIEESLTDPQKVSKIGTTSLRLGDGRLWEIPGAPLSEVGQGALREAVARGVEIDEENNAYGLLKIHHWCGNDPVRKHLARVDLTELLTHVEADRCFNYTQWGWNVSDYYWATGYFDDLDFETLRDELGETTGASSDAPR